LGGGHVSNAILVKAVKFAADSVAPSVEELKKMLPFSKEVSFDVTSHNDNGNKYFTWNFVTSKFAFFKIVENRSTDIIREMLHLGYKGIISFDEYSICKEFLKEMKEYRDKIGNISEPKVSLCWAHLNREIKSIVDSYTIDGLNYGLHLQELTCDLFDYYHQYLKDLSNTNLFQSLEACGKELIRFAIEAAPEELQCQNLAKMLKEYGNYYLTFIYHLNINPCNTASQKAFKHVLMDNIVTKGTRGEKGRKICENLWSALVTCEKQQIDPHEFFLKSIFAKCRGEKGPSLLKKKKIPSRKLSK
jgi:hypothetical protein